MFVCFVCFDVQADTFDLSVPSAYICPFLVIRQDLTTVLRNFWLSSHHRSHQHILSVGPSRVTAQFRLSFHPSTSLYTHTFIHPFIHLSIHLTSVHPPSPKSI